MRRTLVRVASVGLALVLTGMSLPAASAAALPSCSKGTKLKVVKVKATMLLKGKRVACKVVKPAPVAASKWPAPTLKPEIRFASGLMNDLVIRVNKTITLRNADPVARTLVIAELGITVPIDARSGDYDGMGAFFAPSKPGVYTVTILEVPSAKATLTIIPEK